MRFKKGSKVEVLTGKNAWRCAEIVSGNGNSCNVRYYCPLGMSNEGVLERVSEKVIRPCPPPPLDGHDGWSAGDLVEVFDDLCWRTAAVLKAINRGCCLVRLLGSSRELSVHKLNIRARQLWQDGRWVVVGKGSSGCEEVKFNKKSILSCNQKMNPPMLVANTKLKLQGGENCPTFDNNTGLQESCIASARTLKRASPFCSLDVEEYQKKAYKIRPSEKKDEQHQVISGYSSSLPEKVDAGIAYPWDCLGEICLRSYKMKKGMQNCFAESLHERRLELDGSNNDECSVGSCSVVSGNSRNKFSGDILAADNQEADALGSDAKFCYGHGDGEEKCIGSFGEDVAARIHRLELYAYRCTLEALYASGPLSWEQETLLTNLRISLNVSNDEHLMEIRNLIYGRATIHVV